MILFSVCLAVCFAQLPAIEIVNVPAVGIDAPIWLDNLPNQLDRTKDYRMEVVREGNSIFLPLQMIDLFGNGGKRNAPSLLFLLPNTLTGQTEKIRLSIRETAKSDTVFRFEERADRDLRLFEGERPVMVYNFGRMLKEGVPENRARSSYVHPIYGVEGEELSDDFPRDHYHHRGLFWAWPVVQIADRTYSLWDIRGIYHRFERWTYREAGPVCAMFGVQNGWYVGDRKMIDEQVEFLVYCAGETGRAIDVVLHFRALDEPVTLSGTADQNKGYGGFNFRPAPREETKIVTSGGFQEKDSNLLPFPWADMSARFHGRENVTGIAILQDEHNPDFPAGWTLRYYGFLGVAWPGLQDLTIRPGEAGIRLRYRLWIHKGDAETGKVAEAYRVYHEPVSVQVVNE